MPDKAEGSPVSQARAGAALDAALIVLEHGGTTRLAEQTFTSIVNGFGTGAAAVVWRLDHVIVTLLDAEGSTTLMRPVGTVGLNLERVNAAASVARQFERRELDKDELLHELQRVRAIPAPDRWLLAAAAAVAAGAFSQTLAPDAGALATASAAAGVGQAFRSQLQRWRVSRLATTLLCSLASALLAVALLRLGTTTAVPATLIGSVIYAAPGMLLINGYLDLMSERYLFVGLQRLVHAAFLFLILTLSVFVADALL